MNNYKIWTVPNLISFLRILATIPLCYFIITKQNLLVLLLVIISGLSDWLDGQIARRFNQISKLGQALDPIADRMYILCLILFLVFSDDLPFWILLILFIRELAMFVLQLWFSSFEVGAIPVNYLGKTSTALLLYSLPIIYLAKIIDTNYRFIWCFGWAVAIWGIVLHILAALYYFYVAFKYVKIIVNKNNIKTYHRQ
ncbi:MAG: CDP-alcohol phosphatidyltransferase family protein [Bifidobacteriaceae bacterium]|nr:CDP-alcohol phosphatidyltransferase family protein [Bifidobacteriaceae bacterium]